MKSNADICVQFRISKRLREPIRQDRLSGSDELYEDFDADYLVLDLRNSGNCAVFLSLLAKMMHDDQRDVEYAPFTCMNDDVIATRIQSAGARPVIYAITASQKLNSEIALNFRESLSTGRISFLPNLKIAQDEILSNYPGYVRGTPDEQMEFEKPFIETGLMIAETAGLIYEKKEQTGAIVVSEQGDNTKDRYTFGLIRRLLYFASRTRFVI